MSQKTQRWKPDPHQVKCVERGVKKSLALLLDPGLGKTSILLEILRQLLKTKKSKGALVIAPVMPCKLTWPSEIKEWSNFKHLRYTIFANSRQRLNTKRPVDLYLINPERIQWLFDVVLKGIPPKDWPFDTLIVDESAKFKHTTSIRTKALLKQVKHFKWRYIANGTPTGNGFLQLYSQMYIVDRGASLGKNIGQYQEKYFKIVGKPEWKDWQLKSDDQPKRIVKQISKSAICLTAEDHVKMPERIVRPRFIELPPKAQKVYADIETELFHEFENGDELVAESAASLANMLHQVCSGAVYNQQDPLAEYQPPIKRGYNLLHTEKLQVLEDLIEELSGKQLLVGFKFQSDRQILEKHFGKKITIFKGSQIEQIQRDWNNGKIKVLAGQMQSIGFGLNLQKGGAHHIAIYTPTSDFETHDQFTRRLYRRGNTASHVIVHLLLAKGCYDHLVVYDMLTRRDDSHKSFFATMKKYQDKRKNGA